MLYEAIDPSTHDTSSQTLFTCYEPWNYPGQSSVHDDPRSTNR